MRALFGQTWFYIVLTIALIVIVPYCVWFVLPAHPLRIWILDKTVQAGSVREHQGLMWLLNHQKIRNKDTNAPFDYYKDYYGVMAQDNDIRKLPPGDMAAQPDLIYIADTYGINENTPDFYGGLDADDLNPVVAQISRGSTLIAEFNTMASPTKQAARNQLEQIVGVDWQGWMGRYFVDLARGGEVSDSVIAHYEDRMQTSWDFHGPGFVLLSDEDQVIVLEQQKDLGNKLLSVSFEPAYRQEFGVTASVPYYYWFEFGHAAQGTEVLASFHLDATASGLEKLKAANLPADFPAVFRKRASEYSSYYFAGDFADNNHLPTQWNVWGIEFIKSWFAPDIPGEPDWFYWKFYMPLMKTISRQLAASPPSLSQTAQPAAVPVRIHEQAGVKQVAMTRDGHLAVFDGTSWRAKFWNGTNLGATLPGHYPGEVSPSREDYMRWFPQMKQMNINVIRIYTILPPAFYEALDEFNRSRQDPLLLLQGVWTPEEELIGEDRKGNDAYRADITDTFRTEIVHAVKVIHGDISLPEGPGHAGGSYRTDVSQWLLGWVIGTEWYPYAVQATNAQHPAVRSFSGAYFQTAAHASPFECWLAGMLETAAAEEMNYGWQHPISFTNWLTTDPLAHPNEPLAHEDMVSVDPMRIRPTSAWQSGYFASYHAYPYYPDFLRFEDKYQTYRDAQGNINPYAAYLHDLREHHQGIPLIVAEFGVPSSRGMAHYGPAGRNQGMHTEAEQGGMDADMIRSIHDEFYDGAILFEWQDEWFKFTWNTIDYEIPAERRAMWRNRLTNEENFGVMAVEPAKSGYDTIILDGQTDDWQRRKIKLRQDYADFQMSGAHDEAYLYLLLEKKQGSWNLEQEPIHIGFDTLQGGSEHADRAPGLSFHPSIEFLMELSGERSSRLFVNSAYDQHTWLYSATKHMLPGTPNPDYPKAELGIFLPWKLALNKPLVLPQTKVRLPFEELEVGVLRPGRTDPAAADFNTLADWYAQGGILEIRIPWMLLGFTDPSSGLVWDYPYQAGGIVPVPTGGIHIEPFAGAPASGAETAAMYYTWSHWDEPVYHERKKQSYEIIRRIFGELTEPRSRP